MPAKKNSTTTKYTNSSADKNISIGGDVVDSVLVVGDNNTTTFQKIINIFKGESESTEHRNRRVMLNHMENFWIKGVLEKSLDSVALLELGIKENPNAINYPWGIKRASTNEILPAGKPLLEIFKEIGLGRSLLILGAPGSGKTTTLLELTRQLIETARNDETEPIPVVFNLASWTEKFSLADWLANQLNIFYYVPKKTAQKLVTDNQMFLLLDGLDEVKVDLREKCVNAINEFKNQHGLTSLIICSRIEEYQAIQKKLSLAGAITLQPLTTEQVDTYFEKFGKSLSNLKQILKKDKTLRELTETPLMLSIMALAYKDVNIKEVPALKNIKEQRKYLFDTYINRMFERLTRSEKKGFSKEETLHYLSWLANQMVHHNLITYQIEGMQPSWLDNNQKRFYKWNVRLLIGLFIGMFFGLTSGVTAMILINELGGALNCALIGGLFFVFLLLPFFDLQDKIEMVDNLKWSWKESLDNSIAGMSGILILALPCGFFYFVLALAGESEIINSLIAFLSIPLIFGLIGGLIGGLGGEQIEETNYPEQRLRQTSYSAVYAGILSMLISGLIGGIIIVIVWIFRRPAPLVFEPIIILLGLLVLFIIGLIFGLAFGIISLIQHYTLRNMLMKRELLPRHLVSFLDYCGDLIFLSRVGGSYIFVHRLLMEHFAEMEEV